MSRPSLVDPMHIRDVLEEWMEPERPGTPTHPNEPRTQAHNAGTE